MSLPEQFGPYELHELINSGGMADLFLATNEQSRRWRYGVCGRKGRSTLLPNGGFFAGATSLSHIHNHEFVIGYIDHGKVNGSYFLAMEYIEGNNLKLLAADADPVLAENIGTVLIESAQALEHVHDSGFIHLDFKPENILLSRNASLRLVDFDLSIPKPERPTKTKNNPGTPGYMAPEQLLRQEIDHRVDIFAYGVTAFRVVDQPEAVSRRNSGGYPAVAVGPVRVQNAAGIESGGSCGDGEDFVEVPGAKPGEEIPVCERAGEGFAGGALCVSVFNSRFFPQASRSFCKHLIFKASAGFFLNTFSGVPIL